MKNVTLSADAALIERAREKAARDNMSLNAAFRQWLERYVGQGRQVAGYEALMDDLGYADAGRSFTRDERHERR